MLTISGLVKRRGDREILRGVDLALERGSVGVLIGASGSGKSTVLRCVNGLETFDAGEIAVGSARLTAANHRGRAAELAAIRRNAGMVFQQFNLFAHLSVLENVIEAPLGVLRKPRGEATDDAVKLLDRVGLRDRLQAMPHQLSGGQQQRVAIARALAMRPELILFDEPTSALDPKMTGEVLAVMSDLAKTGQSMLVVTHSMTFARKVGTAIHVLSQGRIVESGPPEKIFDNPGHEATRELLQQVAAT